jgi:osmotically-inducible protein OsmY
VELAIPPEAKVHARVENARVTLDGEVDYAYQKREAEVDARHVKVEVTDHTAKL